MLTKGDYEPEIRYVLSQVMTESDWFLDCGANLGWWSIFASTRIADPARILAIEASPTTFRRLVANAQINGGPFQCVQAAIWKESGLELGIRTRSFKPGGASLVVHSKRRPGAYREQSTVSVTLDDVVDRHFNGAQNLIIKLDIEGAEVEALAGLVRHRDRTGLIIYEDHGREASPRATKALLRMGFSIFHCDGDRVMIPITDPVSAQAVKRNARKGYNFFACPPSSRANERLSELAKRTQERDRSAIW